MARPPELRDAAGAPAALDLWEAAAGSPVAHRPLALLRAACPDREPGELAAASPGCRDRHLLDLRELLFGPVASGLAGCPRCGERMEVGFRIADVRLPAYQPPMALEVRAAGYRVCFRLPTSADLADLAGGAGGGDASEMLLRRCLSAVSFDGTGTALPSGGPPTLPPEVIEAVTDRMAEADPQADIEFALRCAACGHRWPAVFDIPSFLWAEIDAAARRILRDVHVLARAYGWPEADILALSPARRRHYREMALAETGAMP